MKPLLLAMAALAVILLAFFYFSCLEQRFRLVGMFLQLLGVVIVALGLNDTRRAFNDLPTIWQRIREAWGARPSWPRPRTFGEACSSPRHLIPNGSDLYRISQVQLVRARGSPERFMITK
jgi:hypothetical protein